jgi:hypothetical protein
MKKINQYCILSKNELNGMFGSRPYIDIWHHNCVKKPALIPLKSETIIRVHREKRQAKKTQYNIRLEVIKNVNNEHLVGHSNKYLEETLSIDVLYSSSTAKLSNYKTDNWDCLSPFLRKYIFYPDTKYPDGKLSIDLNEYSLSWIFKATETDDPDYVDIYVIDFGPKGYMHMCRTLKTCDNDTILKNLPNV